MALLIESTRAYGRGLFQGISKYLRQRGSWSLSLKECGLGNTDCAWLNGWKGDGIIARVEDRNMARIIRRLGVPAVDVRALLTNLGMPAINSDDVLVALMAAEHFLERGFRHFAYCGFDGTDYSDARKEAFARRIGEAGFSCHTFRDPNWQIQATTLEYEGRGLEDTGRVANWIGTLPKPIGLFTCNDIRGQQVLNACHANRVAVPGEVAVLGVDNDEVLCELSDPPLSSVVPNTERIGYEAASLLARMMAGEKPPSRSILIPPSGIMTRRSTDALAIEDPHVASALRYIRDHACEGVQVNDILRAVHLSRRTLARRFSQMLGCSPKEDILRVRLTRVKNLLAETDWSLTLVAEKSGFEHPEYMSVIFKKKTGVTPGEFRAQARGDVLWSRENDDMDAVGNTTTRKRRVTQRFSRAI